MKLADKVAIITGGGSGIGQACCRLIAKEGARVVIADIATEGAKKTAALIEKEDGTCLALTIDVTDSEQIAQMVQATVGEFGTIDILVNNAGIIIQKGLLDTTEEDWDRIQAINLRSVFVICKQVIPEMLKAGKGKIVNIASLAACVADPFQSAYASSKAGVVALTQTMAMEFARRNILINSICPGAVRTNIVIPADQMDHKARMEGVPVGYMAEPEDIAKVALFLASEDSDYLVGENILVDGGISKNFYPVFSPFAMQKEVL